MSSWWSSNFLLPVAKYFRKSTVPSSSNCLMIYCRLCHSPHKQICYSRLMYSLITFLGFRYFLNSIYPRRWTRHCGPVSRPSKSPDLNSFLVRAHKSIGMGFAYEMRRRSHSDNCCCNRKDKYDTSNVWKGMPVIHSPVWTEQHNTWPPLLACTFRILLKQIHEFVQFRISLFFCLCTVHISIWKYQVMLFCYLKWNTILDSIVIIVRLGGKITHILI